MKQILAVLLIVPWCGAVAVAQQSDDSREVEGISLLIDSVRRIELQLQQLGDVRWEYRFLQRNRLQNIEQQLTQLGQQGWELVAVTVEEGFVLKRRHR